MKPLTLKIEGMHCDGCASAIRSVLERTAGVRNAAVSFDGGQARLDYDPAQISEERLVAAIEQGSYRVVGRSQK